MAMFAIRVGLIKGALAHTGLSPVFQNCLLRIRPIA